MIDLDAGSMENVRRILQEHVPECEVRAFGSRVDGGAWKYSDLDLALLASDRVERRKIETLKDAFAESDLPFQVDVLDWNAISDGFRKVVERKFEVIQ